MTPLRVQGVSPPSEQQKIGMQRSIRVIEQDMQMALHREKLVRGGLDRGQAGQIKCEKESFPPSLLLERRDGICRLLLAASSDVYLRIVLQQHLHGLVSDT